MGTIINMAVKLKTVIILSVVTMVPTKLVAVLLVYFVCGYSCNQNIKHDNKVGIIGGHRVSIGKVPFMVSLRLNGTYHWCGGSIIHEKFILTAAHCIVPNREYKVLVGTDHVDQGGDLYDVEKIIRHEKYSNKTDDYDVCMIKIAKNLTFGPKVAKITLADKKTKVKKGTMVDVTGWGNTRPNGSISNNLLQVTVPVVPNFSCQRSYYSAMRLITPRMLCAGTHGKDSCQGDSGGPLTLDNIQIGVVSFGLECGQLPGVYTKITAVLPWIEKTIQENL